MQPLWQRLRKSQTGLVEKIGRCIIILGIIFRAIQQVMCVGFHHYHGNLLFAQAHKPGELLEGEPRAGE